MGAIYKEAMSLCTRPIKRSSREVKSNNFCYCKAERAITIRTGAIEKWSIFLSQNQQSYSIKTISFFECTNIFLPPGLSPSTYVTLHSVSSQTLTSQDQSQIVSNCFEEMECTELILRTFKPTIFNSVVGNPDLDWEVSGSSPSHTKDFKNDTYCSSACAGHNALE